jgi:hypothetical protein
MPNNQLKDLASLGRYGDTMLAHITPEEAAFLKSMGGSGTINPQTGLPEFFDVNFLKQFLPEPEPEPSLGQALDPASLANLSTKLDEVTVQPASGFGGYGGIAPKQAYQEIAPEYSQYADRGIATGMGGGRQIEGYTLPTEQTFQGKPLEAKYDEKGKFKYLGLAGGDVLIPDPNQPNIASSPRINAKGEIIDYGIFDLSKQDNGSFGSFISGLAEDFGPMILAGLGANFAAGNLGGLGGAAGASASEIAASNALANANLTGYAGTNLAATAASGTGGLSSIFNNLSETANNFTQKLGEAFLPGADPSTQNFVGKVVTNTITNGGDIEKGLINTGLSFGSGILGSEVAGATGSDLAGRVASQTAQQLFTTGDVDPTKLAGSEFGRLVGGQVAEETGSNLAGRAASSVTNSVIQGQDATTGLLNLGINEAVNQGANAIEGGLNSVVDRNQTNTQETTGGLNQVANLDDTTNVDQLTGQSNADETVDTRGINVPTDKNNAAPSVLGGATAVGANVLKNVLTSGAKKALTSSLVGSKPVTRPQQKPTQLAATKVAASKPTQPPAQVDVSKLMPVKKATPVVSTAPQKVNVNTLSPLKNTASLTSILKNKSKIG